MRIVATVVLLVATSGAAHASGARLYKSGPIQITADGAVVWVVNPDNDSVGRLDTATETLIEVALPAPATRHEPRGLAVTDAGDEVWVACHSSDRVYVLAGADGTELARIDLPWGTGPYSIVLAPPNGAGMQDKALVTGFRGGRLVVLDVASRSIDKVLEPVFKSPTAATFTADGAAWVTHRFADGEHPRLSRVDFGDPADPKVSTQIRVFPAHPQDSASTSPRIAEGGYQTLRGHPAQVPAGQDGGRLWLPVQYQNIHNSSPSPDAVVQSVIRKVDVDSRRMADGSNQPSNPDFPAKVILSAVDVHDPSAPGGSPVYDGPGWNAAVSGAVDLAFSSDGVTAYVLHEQSEDVVVLPTSTPPVRPAAVPPLTEIPVGKRPMGIVASPVNDLGYVANVLSRDVSVVDLGSGVELSRIPSTPLTGEPFSAPRLRGARIFHSSNEDAISLSRKVACASCHIDAEHDGRIWDLQHLPGNHGPRQTQDLRTVSRTFGPVDPATGWGQLHRSGDRDEVQDFEHTFQGPQMGGTGFLGGGVQPELGPPNAGLSTDLDALAAYIAALAPAPHSPFRDPAGALSPAAVRGATFFMGADLSKPADAQCAGCHVPSAGFVDRAFHDVGQVELPGEQELQNRIPADHVNTATLLGLWLTSPYEGVTGETFTVEGVVLDFARRTAGQEDHGQVDGLTRRQLRDLAELLKSLDGSTTVAEVTGALDTRPPEIVRVAPTSPSRLEVWFDESVEASSAQSPAAWRLVDTATGGELAVLGAALDPLDSDRVTLTIEPLVTGCSTGRTFELSAVGPILDLADTATGGTANALVSSPPVAFTVGSELTITLGASGDQNLTVAVHDAATLPGLTTWSHGSAWIFPSGADSNTGFVRFEWRDPFRVATGLTQSGDLLAARISLTPDLGHAQDLEARRVLQRWWDHRGPDFTSNPVGPTGHGGSTWRDSEHGVRAWNSPNARAIAAGVEGDDPADYFGLQDTAFSADATTTMTAINEAVEFAGARLAAAFRFWFDNPALDQGYAIRALPGALQDVRLEPTEKDFGGDGPVLELTYRLPDTCALVFSDGFESGNASAWSAVMP